MSEEDKVTPGEPDEDTSSCLIAWQQQLDWPL